MDGHTSSDMLDEQPKPTNKQKDGRYNIPSSHTHHNLTKARMHTNNNLAKLYWSASYKPSDGPS